MRAILYVKHKVAAEVGELILEGRDAVLIATTSGLARPQNGIRFRGWAFDAEQVA